MTATPEQIAAAWATWRSRHGGKLGPGPAFVEAIEAAMDASLNLTPEMMSTIDAMAKRFDVSPQTVLRRMVFSYQSTFAGAHTLPNEKNVVSLRGASE